MKGGKRSFLQQSEALLEYLKTNRPPVMPSVFTHGDYCLPNVFGKAGRVTGFIDLGRS